MAHCVVKKGSSVNVLCFATVQKRVNVLLAKMRDGGLPFECDACEFRTVMEGYLARHKRLFHPEEEEDTVQGGDSIWRFIIFYYLFRAETLETIQQGILQYTVGQFLPAAIATQVRGAGPCLSSPHAKSCFD